MCPRTAHSPEHPSPSSSRIAIIGGGISGLYFGWLCQQHRLPFTLFEKNSHVGGSIQTFRKDDEWTELGAHTLYRTYTLCLELIQALDLKDAIEVKPKLPYKIKQGTTFKTPFQCLNVFQALHSFFTSRFKKKEWETIEQKFSSLLGSKNFDHVIRPFFNALLNQEAQTFPAALVFKKRIKNKDWPSKFTFKKGLSTLVETLYERLAPSIVLNTTIKSIQQENHGYTLHFQSGEALPFQTLVFATPVHQTHSYLSHIEPSLAHLLKECHIAPSKAIAVQTPPLKLPLLAGAISDEDLYRSFLSHDEPGYPNARRWFTFHFKPGHSDEEYLASIRKTLFLSKETPVNVQDQKQNEMPLLSIASWKGIQRLNTELKKSQTLFVCGNYFQGVAIEDCLVRAKSEFERLLAGVKK